MRAFLSAVLAAISLAGVPRAHAGEAYELRFEVFLEDRAIGHQRFQVRRSEGVRRVTVEADFDVRIWLFSLYTYRHTNEETWENGCLRRIEATTDDNGTQLHVRGRQGEDGFRVETGTATVTLDDCVWSFAYWDERFLSRRHLLNAQTGAYEAVKATLVGSEAIAVAGVATKARRYLLRGPGFEIDLWYSREGELLALESTVGGGRRLRYVRQVEPGEPRASTASGGGAPGE